MVGQIVAFGWPIWVIPVKASGKGQFWYDLVNQTTDEACTTQIAPTHGSTLTILVCAHSKELFIMHASLWLLPKFDPFILR